MLRRIAFGDTSWILHVHTAEEGNLSLLARGARRPQSPFAGSLDPLSLSEVVVSHKAGRDLQTLTQAACLQPRTRLRRDLPAMAAGLVCAEVVLRLSGEGGGHPGLLDLLEGAIGALERDGFRPELLWAFLGGFSEEMGWALAVDHCPACGADDPIGTTVLSLEHGGFLCDPCSRRSHQPALGEKLARCLAESSRGLSHPAGLERPQQERIEDLWFEHILRHAHLRPRLESRQFLSEVRP